jgi:hypothetical protein
MAYFWSHRFCGLSIALLVSGCGPIVVASDPTTFPVPADAAARVRGQQDLVLKNAYEKETLAKIFAGGGDRLQADLRQYTDSAITLLGGALTVKGINLSPQAAKSVTLRVKDVRVDYTPIPLVTKYDSSLVLEAQYGDGTRSAITAANNSPGGYPRAVSGAIMRAVTQLLRDENFLAYANR